MAVIGQVHRSPLTGTLIACAQVALRLDGLLERRLGKRIDEIALLVDNEMQLTKLTHELRLLGWTGFNSAQDHIRAWPIMGEYDVEYFFFSHPNAAWRLEVMKIMSGLSPLHHALKSPTDAEMCRPVHASFKCDDEADYAVACQVLHELAMLEAQRCDGTYGRFSYWTPSYAKKELIVPFLKPRVNLRDGRG